METGSGIKNRFNASKTEVICRSLFTLNLVMLAGSLLTYVQTEYQLVSPLIPSDVVGKIVGPYMQGSLVASILLIPSLWFYFYRKLAVVIVLQVLSIVGFAVAQYF